MASWLIVSIFVLFVIRVPVRDWTPHVNWIYLFHPTQNGLPEKQKL